MAKLKLEEAAALLDRAMDAGLVSRGGGNWIAFGDKKLGQGVKNATEALAENEGDIAASIETALTAKAAVDQAGHGGGVKPPLVEAPAGFKDHPWPLPANLKLDDFEEASIVVTTKRRDQTRWRIGRQFRDTETLIAADELTGEQLAALTSSRSAPSSCRNPSCRTRTIRPVGGTSQARHATRCGRTGWTSPRRMCGCRWPTSTTR
jgi:hypothetical protein